MASLAETNPYIIDPIKRQRMRVRNAYDSSVFEGAEGLDKPDDHPDSDARPIAEAKKAQSGLKSSTQTSNH